MGFLDWLFSKSICDTTITEEQDAAFEEMRRLAQEDTCCSDYVKVDFSKLSNEEMYSYPWEFQLKAMDYRDKYGNSVVRVPLSIYNEAKEKYNKLMTDTANINRAVELNNKGKALEKEGKTDEAIALYEENALNEFVSIHPFQRLVVLYRKRKDYQNEKRIALLAVERLEKYPTEVEKYQKRIEKIDALIAKANI